MMYRTPSLLKSKTSASSAMWPLRLIRLSLEIPIVQSPNRFDAPRLVRLETSADPKP